MDLSIIIAHYCTERPSKHYDSFLKTLKLIRSQSNNLKIEVIVADDGSSYSKNISQKFSKKIAINDNERYMYYLEGSKLSNWLNSFELNKKLISKWIYIPKTKLCMSKARLWNYATKLSKSENLFFLDDDNYFISDNSLQKLLHLFEQFEVIFGQIKDQSGRLRNFSSNRVQGTTIGIKKQTLKFAGGFGSWTEEISCGIDSDLWIKLYEYHKLKTIRACYTNQIQTYDSCSKRWKPYTKIFKDFVVKQKFKEIYGIKNYKSAKHNPSRNKSLWIKNLI